MKKIIISIILLLSLFVYPVNSLQLDFPLGLNAKIDQWRIYTSFSYNHIAGISKQNNDSYNFVNLNDLGISSIYMFNYSLGLEYGWDEYLTLSTEIPARLTSITTMNNINGIKNCSNNILLGGIYNFRGELGGFDIKFALALPTEGTGLDVINNFPKSGKRSIGINVTPRFIFPLLSNDIDMPGIGSYSLPLLLGAISIGFEYNFLSFDQSPIVGPAIWPSLGVIYLVIHKQFHLGLFLSDKYTFTGSEKYSSNNLFFILPYLSWYPHPNISIELQPYLSFQTPSSIGNGAFLQPVNIMVKFEFTFP